MNDGVKLEVNPGSIAWMMALVGFSCAYVGVPYLLMFYCLATIIFDAEDFTGAEAIFDLIDKCQINLIFVDVIQRHYLQSMTCDEQYVVKKSLGLYHLMVANVNPGHLRNLDSNELVELMSLAAILAPQSFLQELCQISYFSRDEYCQAVWTFLLNHGHDESHAPIELCCRMDFVLAIPPYILPTRAPQSKQIIFNQRSIKWIREKNNNQHPFTYESGGDACVASKAAIKMREYLHHCMVSYLRVESMPSHIDANPLGLR
jgi:hypothetical protein